MAALTLEQALFSRPDRREPTLRARSPGFTDAWMHAAEQMIRDFGDRPVGVRCPLAVFARPLTTHQVALVRVSDRSETELGFHFLVLERSAYEHAQGDPFALAERFPPVWQAEGELPALTLPLGPWPERTVAQVQSVLRRVKASALREDEDPESPHFERTIENSESPALLGGAQVLVDGGRLVFERPAGDLPLLAGLWLLLPTRTRARLWPASFAFSNRLGFDALVVPVYDPEEFEGYTTEEQAADYPPGSYELALQMAAEASDQPALDRVFARRDSGETLRLAGTLLVVLLLVVVGGSLLGPSPNQLEQAAALAERREQAAVAAGMAAAADPWTALGLYQYGKGRWGQVSRQ